MNSTNKKSPEARGISQPFKQQVGRAHQIKPGVAQLKTGVSAQSIKQPVAPPAYRPQATPNAAQPKMANGAVNRTPPVAPPVYRPQQAPKVLQTKSSSAQNSQAGQAPRRPVAPTAYRPQQVPKVLQTKSSATQSPHAVQVPGKSFAPTVSHREAKQLVQPKAVSPQPKAPTAPTVYRPQSNALQLSGGRATNPTKQHPPNQQTKPARPQMAQVRSVNSAPVGSTIQCNFELYSRFLEHKNFMTPKIQKRLQEGQEAILKTRKKLSAGAGNIGNQVKTSQGYSFALTHHAKETANLYASTGVTGNPIEAWAISARRARAGNCDEFAAVTYYYLLEMNTGDDISVVGLPDVHHHFVLIGDPANPSTDDAVVVDPWPAKGWAVHYDHWEYKGSKMQVTLGPTRSTGQTPLKTARTKLNKLGHTKEQFDKATNAMFDKYASSEKMRTKIDEIAKDKQRRYFWGNEYTMKEEHIQSLKAFAERVKKRVNDPLGLSNEDFDALYRS
ncbi:MAG TPA: hypothetical protein VJ842_16460 [Pyrinomonadaceae bacterium]|nr:hypothetical protein [Pyrinomonadaceae bacterium]